MGLPQKFIMGLLTILSIPLAVYVGTLCGDENVIYIAPIIAAVIGIVVVAQPVLLAVSIPILYQSGLQLPGLGRFTLFHMAIVALIVVALSRACLKQKLKIQWNWANFAMLAFLLVIAMTMKVRGSGFRFLGSNLWGGMGYVQVFITAILALLYPIIILKPRQWKLAVLGMGLAAFLPAIVEILVVKSSVFYPLAMFIKTSDQIGGSVLSHEAEKGVVRYFSCSVAAMYILVGVSACVNLRRLNVLGSFWYYMVLAGSLTLTAFSGFRSSLFMILGTFGGVVLLQRALNLYKILTLVCVCLFGYLLLLQFSEQLPAGMQRTASVVPGIKTDYSAAQDAQKTTDWRIELWKDGLKIVPQYWLVGKGYAFGAEDMESAQIAKQYYGDHSTWAKVAVAYHNGPLSLLLGLGVFGILSGMAFLWFATWRHWNFYRGQWHSEQLRLVHLAVFAYFFVHVMAFLLIYGDVVVSYPILFFLYAILEAVVISDQNFQKTKYRDSL